MVQIVAVSKVSDGFAMKTLNVKSMDMNEIAKVVRSEVSGWGFDDTNFEIFKYNPKGGNWLVVAQHTGRGWVRISTWVKNWEKYATPSWKAQALRFA